MFDPKSDYALNKKDREAIVYRDATGTLVRLTVDDFSSEAEFLKWKAWSDETYHDVEKEDHVYANHTWALSEYSAVTPSPELAIIEAHDDQERRELGALLMEGLGVCLTPTQYRRLWLSCVEGLTEEAIARSENVKQQNVSKSILAAKKKLEKFLRGRV